MQPLTVARASSPIEATASWRPARVPLGRAVTALLLLAVLSTAGFVHVIWQRTASRNVETVVTSLDAQSSAAVRNELTSTLSLVASTAEIVRSILYQGAIKADDEVKREFLFLSLLREQPAIAWIGFGFPDGRFFGSHATADGKIEMLEIGMAAPGENRPSRSDIYSPIPGDIFFEKRTFGETAYIPIGAPWYRFGKDSSQPLWSVADILPSGFEPSIVVSKRVEIFGKFQGVVMVAVSLRRLSKTLAALDMTEGSKAFVIGGNGLVLATSSPGDGIMAARLADYPPMDMLAAAVAKADAAHGSGEYHTTVDSNALGSIFVSSSALPFQDWRLLTAIPRSALAGDIDRNTQRVLLIVGAMALLAAVSAILMANLLFARPLKRLVRQLRAVEHFQLDRVRHSPTFLAELNDFSQALRRMAGGLSAFAKYMPIDIVRPLVDEGVEPRPGGQLKEITVLFADLPGFTELTEQLGPGVEPHLTSFLTLAVDAIHAEGGTVDKFIGDAVMAIWNAPGAAPDHALRACRAATAIRDAMHVRPAISPDRDAIRVRIGINTGTALVGNVGSTERLSYTAIGDAVNLASRLVGVAKEHGVEIVVSGSTLDATAGAVASRPLGVSMVRGKATSVEIHALV
jgi:adenylate cyclase